MKPITAIALFCCLAAFPAAAEEPDGRGYALFVVGAGPGEPNEAFVRVFDTRGSGAWSPFFFAYPGQDIYGVNVDTGDMLAGDGIGEIVTGMGPGPQNPALVRVFTEPASLFDEFLAYGSKFGVRVACGDIDGDGIDEILTCPGPGAALGAHVRAFKTAGQGCMPFRSVNFKPFSTRSFGCQISLGDLDGDGRDEILATPGPGSMFGPHVRGYQFDGTWLTVMADINFFAFNTRRYSCLTSTGDIDGDHYHEFQTTPGPSPLYGALVRVWNYDGAWLSAVTQFVAYRHLRFGAVTTAGDIDGDTYHEIITAPGPGPAYPAHIRGWDLDTGTAEPIPAFDFIALGPMFKYGANLGFDNY
jgi:hypothetical protein